MSKEVCAPADFFMFVEMYSFLKSSNVDINEFLSNEDAIVYNYAKEYALKNNKKKVSKKNKQILIGKFYNLFKSNKFGNFILFQQSMYVLLNC